ncbi:MAG: hypothetical protein J6577_10780 [Gilliamella sp.]|nr:hypothetical protein [Gilliamella sp.]
MKREAFKRVFKAFSRLISALLYEPMPPAINQSKGKGKNKTAHTPTGIAKARQVARKNRNKKRSK